MASLIISLFVVFSIFAAVSNSFCNFLGNLMVIVSFISDLLRFVRQCKTICRYLSMKVLWNWEHGTEPELKHIPAVSPFLAMFPGRSPTIRLKNWRTSRRLMACHYDGWGRLWEEIPNNCLDGSAS